LIQFRRTFGQGTRTRMPAVRRFCRNRVRGDLYAAHAGTEEGTRTRYVTRHKTGVRFNLSRTRYATSVRTAHVCCVLRSWPGTWIVQESNKGRVLVVRGTRLAARVLGTQAIHIRIAGNTYRDRGTLTTTTTTSITISTTIRVLVRGHSTWPGTGERHS